MMVTKGTRSLQLSLNRLIPKLGLDVSTVSNAAYSKARAKLKHTAFIELNKRAVVAVMYEEGDHQTFKGFRLLALDGSDVRLPDDETITREFGTLAYRNGQPGVSGAHAMARASVVYDVLNRIALDARLEPVAVHETTIAAHQLQGLAAGDSLRSNDLIIKDRGYHSYRMMAITRQTGAHFLIRCKRGSGMLGVDRMLDGRGPAEQIVTLAMPKGQTKRPEYQGLPVELAVRFVRVKLKTGEYEVLATSVLDPVILSRADLKELYRLRWGIETFYGILKTRLGLENFSGLSPEAIRQDFHAAVLLTGLESILTMDAEAALRKQRGGYPKKVNKAVSFSIIKERAFELFYSDTPMDEATKELTELFMTSPTLIREDRNPPRKRHADNKVLAWYRRRRKGVF